MSLCPFCGQRLSVGVNKCEKCGAVISEEPASEAFQCPKCGGALNGTETKCSWCNFPVGHRPIVQPSEFYSEIAVDTSVPYGVLSVKCSDAALEVLHVELSLGRISDVVRPKPIHGEIALPRKNRMTIEEDIRELLQVFARSDVGRAIRGGRLLSHFVKGVGEIIHSYFIPDTIKEPLRTMSEGSLLTLALDESVLGLPWELAFDGSECLCTKFAVGRVIFSGRASVKKRKPQPETRVLLISNPDNSLSETTERVALPIKEKLEKLGAEVVHMYYSPGTRHHTNKQNVQEALGSGAYDIIHFVGHGSYDPRFPQESGFALADNERLSAQEISEILDFAGRSGKDAPFLFYAHSCEAGAQRSWDMRAYESQISGMSEAFIKHNVAYIGAFWSANVEAADALALAFYDALLERKEPLGLALMNARLIVRSKLTQDHPNCEWANFILYGDPSITIKI